MCFIMRFLEKSVPVFCSLVTPCPPLSPLPDLFCNIHSHLDPALLCNQFKQSVWLQGGCRGIQRNKEEANSRSPVALSLV